MSYRSYLCQASGDLFVKTVEMGLDSVKFVEKLFHAEVASVFYNNWTSSNWLGASYVLEVMDHELHFERGITLDKEFMYWAGCIYRAWSLVYEDTPEEIYRQAPIEVLQQMFLGLHVMTYEMAVEDLRNMYRANREGDHEVGDTIHRNPSVEDRMAVKKDGND